MLPCWQLQELAEGIGDINTEAKLLLLIITFMCVRVVERMEGGEGSPQKGWHCSALPVKSALPRGWLWRCGEVRGQRLSGLGAGADRAPPPKQGPGGAQEPPTAGSE